jgi:EAL domain-containing protein (putative c-di-GMP-specific phosphodiesterase class I)
MDTTLLSIETLPWVACAVVAARYAFYAARTSRLHAQLAVTQDRLDDALSRIDQLGGHAQAHADVSLERDLRHAVARGEIEVHYQPQVSFGSGRVTGAEALVRWRHPSLGLLSPDRFVPIAEQTGLIRDIGHLALRRACEQAVEWDHEGCPFTVAVNLCASQFQDPALVERVAGILAATGAEPSRIVLELTESMVMQEPEHARAVMGALRRMGLQLALDDFGTGHSSLASLKRFPIDQLKIDRAFVRGLPGDVDDVAIVRAIVAMAHGLGIMVVAEGVESEAQFEALHAEGCDEFQGFYCSAALPQGDALRFILAEQAMHAAAALREAERGARVPAHS